MEKKKDVICAMSNRPSQLKIRTCTVLQYAALFTEDTHTMRPFFAQQDHMQVLKFVLNCLETWTLFLLPYAIRLVWLAKAL